MRFGYPKSIYKRFQHALFADQLEVNVDCYNLDSMLKYRYFHFLLIPVVLLIPVFSSPDFNGSFDVFAIPPMQRDFLKHILLLAFFYLNYYLLFPKLIPERKIVVYVLCLLVIYWLVSNIPYWLIPNDQPTIMHPMMKDSHVLKRYFSTVFPFLLVILITAFFYLFRRKETIETEKIKAELLSLKYQLQPHFMMNTLNNMYALALRKSEDVPELLIKLSNLMRYILSESSKDRVPLERELQHINDYVTMQLLKTDDSLDFVFEMNGDPEDLEIAPMILVDFIENAFKYGVNSEEQSVVHLSFRINENKLFMEIFNRKVAQLPEDEPGTGIGQRNTLKRLEHLYHGKYKIEMMDQPETYTVKLLIDLAC